jgi:hypothetical protein
MLCYNNTSKQGKILKYKYTTYICCMLVACLISISVVAASASGATAVTQLKIPDDPNKTSTLAERLIKLESKYKTQLDALSKVKVASSCESAQVKLKAVKTKDETATNQRQKTYTNLSEKLNSIVVNLQRQKVDATKLAEAQNKYNADINTYLDDLQNYKTALDDAITVQCAEDPTGFYASILEARGLRIKLMADEKAIKAATPVVTQAANAVKQHFVTKSNPRGTQ